MTQLIRSDQRHHADLGWLDTRWHFSFNTYYDPTNMNWGVLRVFNDDVVQPGEGFGAHPHRDMEIVTVVLEGELEHQDHLGNSGVLRPGDVQVMSAGKGIVHSEYNHSDTRPVHFLQLWVLPRHKGATPRWEQKHFPLEERRGRLLAVVSAGEIPGTLAIDQDVQIYLSKLSDGQEVVHAGRPERKAYLFVISGRLMVNNWELSAGDQARIADEARLAMKAEEDAELILLDLPA